VVKKGEHGSPFLLVYLKAFTILNNVSV